MTMSDHSMRKESREPHVFIQGLARVKEYASLMKMNVLPDFFTIKASSKKQSAAEYTSRAPPTHRTIDRSNDLQIKSRREYMKFTLHKSRHGEGQGKKESDRKGRRGEGEREKI